MIMQVEEWVGGKEVVTAEANGEEEREMVA